MRYYDREEWPGFLSAIRAAPTDDLPRLVAADWLEENGEPERAEFIRVQSSLTAKTSDIARILGEKECERWVTAGFGQADNWAWSGGLMTCYDDPVQVATSVGAAITYERGFISRVRAPLAVLVGGECGRCGGVGHLDLYSCPGCYLSNAGTGTTRGVLRELLRREPLGPEGIEVSDREPLFMVPLPLTDGHATAGVDTYRLLRDDGLNTPAMIPGDVLDAMTGEAGLPSYHWGRLFYTESAARLALSRAVYAMCSPKSEVKV